MLPSFHLILKTHRKASFLWWAGLVSRSAVSSWRSSLVAQKNAPAALCEAEVSLISTSYKSPSTSSGQRNTAAYFPTALFSRPIFLNAKAKKTNGRLSSSWLDGWQQKSYFHTDPCLPAWHSLIPQSHVSRKMSVMYVIFLSAINARSQGEKAGVLISRPSGDGAAYIWCEPCGCKCQGQIFLK